LPPTYRRATDGLLTGREASLAGPSARAGCRSPGAAGFGHRPGRRAGALVVLLGGVLALLVERGGRTILSDVNDEGAIHNTPLGRALTAAGFRQTPRGLWLGG
jgi:ATP-dependent helicase Lhr and Lhr-like helicase